MIILSKNSGVNRDHSHLGNFTNYNDLIAEYPTGNLGDIAHVDTAQGLKWLSPIIGNYYPKGMYRWNGSAWESDVRNITDGLGELTSETIFNSSVVIGVDAVLTPTQLTANVNNYDPPGWRDGDGSIQRRILRLSSDGGTKRITGLRPSSTAMMNIITIVNVGTSGTVQPRNNNSNSTPEYRFLLGGNNSIEADEAATYYYDTTDLRWRAMNDWK